MVFYFNNFRQEIKAQCRFVKTPSFIFSVLWHAHKIAFDKGECNQNRNVNANIFSWASARPSYGCSPVHLASSEDSPSCYRYYIEIPSIDGTGAVLKEMTTRASMWMKRRPRDYEPRDPPPPRLYYCTHSWSCQNNSVQLRQSVGLAIWLNACWIYKESSDQILIYFYPKRFAFIYFQHRKA